jgi:hypothetical protein
MSHINFQVLSIAKEIIVIWILLKKINRHEENKNKQRNYYLLSNLDSLNAEMGPLRPCGRIYFAANNSPTQSLPFPVCNGVSLRVPLLVGSISASQRNSVLPMRLLQKID